MILAPATNKQVFNIPDPKTESHPGQRKAVDERAEECAARLEMKEMKCIEEVLAAYQFFASSCR
jgi:hypothetical protein